MKTILIDVSNVLANDDKIKNAGNKLDSALSGLQNVKVSLASDVSARYNIRADISNAVTKLSGVKGKVSQIRKAVNEGANSYYQTEKNLLNKANQID